MLDLGPLRQRHLALRASHGDDALFSPEGASLREALRGCVTSAGGHVFGSAASIAVLWDALDAVAFGTSNVLVVGQRGTGKEAVATVLAEALGVDIVSVNCATLVPSLADAELFGVGGGAGLPGVPSTGTRGYVEQAQGGLLFLDEIFDAPFLFPKLLRLLQQRVYSRVADPAAHAFEGTIVAASNRFPSRTHLAEGRDRGDVRADLVDRFLVLEVPPLAKRTEEIGVLADHFLARLHRTLPECPFDRLDPDTARALSTLRHPWPGNLRELNQLLRTQAQLRRHTAPTPPAALHIPAADLERLLRDEPQAAQAEAGDLGAWTRDGVRRLRIDQLRAALAARRDREGRSSVDAAWVAAHARELLGVTGNISERLRSAGTTCREVAAWLSGR